MSHLHGSPKVSLNALKAMRVPLWEYIDCMKGLLIGCGHIGSRHIAAFNRFRNVIIIGVYDPDPVAAAAACSALRGSPIAASSVDELLELNDADFLDIAGLHDRRRDIIAAASRRGIHIMLSPPAMESFDEIDHVINLISDTGIIVNVAEYWRYHAHFRALKRNIDAGLIGDVVYVRHVGKRPDSPGRLAEIPASLNGADAPLMASMGHHWLDTARFLFGDPVSISCRTRQLNRNFSGEDMFHVTLHFENDLLYQLDGSRAALAAPDQGPEIVAEGTRGTLILGREPYYSMEVVTEPGISHPLSYVVPAKPFQDSIDTGVFHCLKSFNDRTECETGIADHIKTLQLIDAGYRSARLDQTVTLTRERIGEIVID